MKKTIVFLGNCQAGVLRIIYDTEISQHTGHKTIALDTSTPLTDHSRHIIETADYIVEQVFNRSQAGNLQGLATKAKVIRFPYVSGYFLWPYAGEGHPTQTVNGVNNPFAGREIGDMRLVKGMRAKLKPEKLVSDYCLEDVATAAHCERMLDLHLEMQRGRDENAGGFSVASVIEQNFRSKRLFTTPGHPGPLLFLPVVDAVLDGLDVPRSLRDAVRHRTLSLPFAEMEHPIHPSIGEHFGLEYAKHGATFLSALGEKITFVEWCQGFVSLKFNIDLARALAQSRNVAHQDKPAARLAIEALKQAVESSSGSYFAEHSSARLCAHLDDHAGALLHVRKALLLRPDAPGAWFSYGLYAARCGENLLAEEAFTAALRLQPKAASVHSALSLVKLELGLKKQALETAETALRLDAWQGFIRARYERIKALP